MRRRSLAMIGLLVVGTSLNTGCGGTGHSAPTGPPPVVIGPRAVLLRTPNSYSRTSVAFSPDGRTVAVGREESSQGIVSLFDVTALRERATIKGPSSEFCTVAFSPNGRTLAVGLDRTIRLYDPETAQEQAQLAVEDVIGCVALAFSADGRKLIAGTEMGRLIVWEIGSGFRPAILKNRTSTSSLRGIAVSPDARWVATALDGPIVCHRIGWSLFGLGVTGWACGTDGNYVRLFDVATGQEKGSMKYRGRVRTVSFSPDGTLLASDDSDAAHLWDLARGETRNLLAADEEHWVDCVSFAPDGRTLAVGLIGRISKSSQSEVRLWDMDRSRVRAILRGEMGMVDSLAFAPDGKTLVTGSETAVVLWDLATASSQSLHQQLSR